MPKNSARPSAGRRVIPISEKIAKGTFRPERQKKIPQPDERLPIPPSWLNKRAKQIFRLLVKRITSITVASIDHTEAISLLASRLEEVQRLDKYLNEHGYTYEQNGIITVGKGEDKKKIVVVLAVRSRPEVKQRHEAMKHLHSLLLEFGLTASSLGRVAAKEKKSEDDNEFADF